MSSVKLFDSELKVMDVLWKEGDLPAGKISTILNKEIAWNRNTTYTVIKKCITKGAIERTGSNFTCHALITRQEAQEYETEELINKMFSGSPEMLFSTFVNEKNLTHEQIERLKKIVNSLK